MESHLEQVCTMQTVRGGLFRWYGSYCPMARANHQTTVPQARKNKA